MDIISRISFFIAGKIVNGVSRAIENKINPPKYEPPIFPDRMDCGQLEQYLKNGQWKEADIETANLMLKHTHNATRISEWSRFNFNPIFWPYKDLKTIDNLWTEYSEGKFGFSAQLQVWLACGGNKSFRLGTNDPGTYPDFSEFFSRKKIAEETYYKFIKEIGWRIRKPDEMSEYDYDKKYYHELAFRGSLLKGQLPLLIYMTDYSSCMMSKIYGSPNSNKWIIEDLCYRLMKSE